MREIFGDAKTVRKLLSGAKYSIDYYQRQYRWQNKQVSELIDDLTGRFQSDYEEGYAREEVEQHGHYFLGSLTSNTSGEGDIRKAIIEADMVDCIIALPGQLFYTTGIPACLWFLTRNKGADKERGFRARHGETLFIDARRQGYLIDRAHRDLTDEEILQIAGTYHAWRGETGAGKYEDKAGFCKAATLKDIASHGHVLTPGRYVGAEEIEDDGIPFEEKMAELSSELYEQMSEGLAFDAAIRKNLEALGYGA